MAVFIPCPLCDGSAQPAAVVARDRQLEPRQCPNCRCYFRAKEAVCDGDHAEPLQVDAAGKPVPPPRPQQAAPHFSLLCPTCPSAGRPPTRLLLRQRDRVLRCTGCGGYFRAPPEFNVGTTVLGVSTDEHGVPRAEPRRPPPPVLIGCPICPSAVSPPRAVPVNRHRGEHRCPVCGVRFLVRDTAPGELAVGILLREEEERRGKLRIHPLDAPLVPGRGGGFPGL